MNHFPQAWGRPRDDVYGAYDHSYLQSHGPRTHTQSPAVTGTSVIGVKFKDGVVLAADNLASYGSLARFTDVKRLRRFNSHVAVGFGGDVSDMQHIDRLLSSLGVRENYGASSAAVDDEISGEVNTVAPLNAENLHTYLSKVMYKRRTEINPLWNVILVAGLDGKDDPFLASVDLLGTTFSAPTLATGFGAHLAQPVLRRRVPDEDAAKVLSKEDAVQLVRDCMKVLFYRDARSLDRFSIAVVSKTEESAADAEGKKAQSSVELMEDEKLGEQSWAFAENIRGYGTQVV